MFNSYFDITRGYHGLSTQGTTMKVRGQPCIRELASSYSMHGAYQVTLFSFTGVAGGSCKSSKMLYWASEPSRHISLYTCTYKDIKTVPEILLSLFYRTCLRNSVAHDLTNFPNFRTQGGSLALSRLSRTLMAMEPLPGMLQGDTNKKMVAFRISSSEDRGQ